MQEYNKFRRIAEQARQTIGIDRKIYVEKAYYLFESKLTLLGATGIEDSLQEGVEETLESLRAAGIKVRNYKNIFVSNYSMILFMYLCLLNIF